VRIFDCANVVKPLAEQVRANAGLPPDLLILPLIVHLIAPPACHSIPFGPSRVQRPVAYTTGTTPSADFFRAINGPCESPSPGHAPKQPGRSPAIRSKTFNARPPNFRFVPLMDRDLAVS
jgi:hypothetical protein